MLPQTSLTTDLSAEPILAAVESYRGTILALDTGTRVEASDFAAAREALGRRLEWAGIGHGDRVVMAVSNGPLFPAALAAILSRGASPLLLHAKTPPAELRRHAERYAARLVLSNVSGEADYRAAGLEPFVLEASSWARLLAADVGMDDSAALGDSLVLPGVPLHPTSGTTGQPKVALRPGPAAIAEARHYIETAGIGPEDTLLVAAPQSHAYCYGMGTMVPLLSGASIVTMPAFETEMVHRALRTAEVTVFPAVPAMLGSLIFGVPAGSFAGVHTVFSAGAPLSEKTAAAFDQKFGVTVRPLYGTTETGGIAISAAGSEAVRGICVGPPMRGVEAEVRSAGDGLAPGVGMLYIRSESMMAGYLDEHRLDQTMLVDGWFKTGDLATVDPHGRISLHGRQSEVINVAGLKVIPSEVESVLLSMPGVREVKVYARQRRTGTQSVKAAVVGEEVSSAEVRTFCEQQLVYYKRPSSVSILPALPRNPAGKIALDQLP